MSVDQISIHAALQIIKFICNFVAQHHRLFPSENYYLHSFVNLSFILLNSKFIMLFIFLINVTCLVQLARNNSITTQVTNFTLSKSTIFRWEISLRRKLVSPPPLDPPIDQIVSPRRGHALIYTYQVHPKTRTYKPEHIVSSLNYW